MRDRFVPFILLSRRACAVLALVYHVRFLHFVDYGSVQAGTALTAAFYFLTGYGHEWFAVFFVLDGIVAGLVLTRRRAAAWRHLGTLYALLLPGLLLGAALDSAGFRYLGQSGIYTAYPAFSTLTLGPAPLLGNLFMLQPFAVPTYGSNGMLYLLSYLFWCFLLACLLVRAAAFGRVRGRACQGLLLALVVLMTPAQFLHWAAIWMMGVAMAVLGETRRLRPSLFTGMLAFSAALLLSRILGSHADALPPPLGAWLAHSKYLLVGIGFAAVALALYPQRQGDGQRWVDAAIGAGDGRAGRLAGFVFFFHFPVMMLLAAATALLHQPLMRQPTAAGYAGFALFAAACLAATVAAARASDAVLRRVLGGIYIRIHPPMKSVSSRNPTEG